MSEPTTSPAPTSQPRCDVTIRTTEMHTAGEPVRIIESGYPVPQGKTILDKIQDLKQNHDAFRKLVMWEPHGHYDMYGVLPVAPDIEEADVGVIFMHNEGYSTMCGHACISFGRYAIERGLIRRPVTYPETEVLVQTPCGLVKIFVDTDNTNGLRTGHAHFESVPSFVVDTDVTIDVPDLGPITMDVTYGGAFYALVATADVDVTFGETPASEMRRIASKIKAAAIPKLVLSHPTVTSFLYGVIFVDSRTSKSDVATNFCVFADSEVDRSPCGSGTSARVAQMFHRGLLAKGESQVFRSGVTGVEFKGKVMGETTVGDRKAVITDVSGRGYYTGHSTLTLEEGDEVGRGFLVR